MVSRTTLRIITLSVIAIFAVVLVMHLGVMGAMPSAEACHAVEATCIVSDTLQEALAATTVFFGVLLAIVVVETAVRMRLDAAAARIGIALHAMRQRSLAQSIPELRALTRGIRGRRCGAGACPSSVRAAVAGTVSYERS